MRIGHRIWLGTSLEKQQSIEHVGIELKGKTFFEIMEEDARWVDVKRLVTTLTLADSIYVEYSELERTEAKYLRAYGAWQQGYPESFGDGGYKRTTYDSSNACIACGIGRKQVAPFRMMSPPKWGTRSVRMLYCIEDEFFVTPEGWQTVFRNFGIGYREVKYPKADKVIDNVVQLDITDITQIDTGGLKYSDCAICGTRKFPYDLTGRYFHPRPSDTTAHMFKSDIYWGTDAAAWKTIMVSQDLYQAIKKASLRGIGFVPCEK